MTNIIKLIFAVFLMGISLQTYAANEPTIVNPDTLKWAPSKSLPGAEVALISGNPEKKGPFIARVKLPANFQIPVHMHAINENDTVLSGKLFLGIGTEMNTEQGMEVPAGGFVMIPAKLSHYAWTKEETILQINGMGPWGMIYKKK